MKPTAFAFVLSIVGVLGGQVLAADRIWDDGGATNKNWNNRFNWSGNLVPQLDDDVFIGGLADGTPSAVAQNDTVLLDVNVFAADAIGALALTNGADLRTNGFQLTIAGDTVVNEDSGSVILQIDSSGLSDDYDTDNMDVLSGALVLLQGGILEIDEVMFVDQDSNLNGFGTIDFGDSAATVLNLIGDLTTNSGGDIVLNANGGGGIDLDGSGTGGGTNTIRVQGGTSGLIVNGSLVDTFSSTMVIGVGNTVTMTDGWTADSSAQINMNSGSGVGEIAGGTFNLTGTLTQIAGTTLISADFNANSGADLDIGGNGLAAALQLDGTAVINASADVQLISSLSDLIINGDTTINQTIFDWDSSGEENTTTINDGASLTINSTQIDVLDDAHHGTITLNSGVLDVNIAGAEWRMDGTMNLNKPSGFQTIVSGKKIAVDGALNVSGGLATIDTFVDLEDNADVNIQNGASLNIARSVRFEPASDTDVDGTLRLFGTITYAGGAITGDGTINQQAGATVTGDTTIDLSQSTGVYNWDGALSQTEITTINADKTLRIAANRINTTNNNFNGTVNINGGTVDVKTATTWTATGTIAFNGFSQNGTLDGQDLSVQGAGSAFTTIFGNAIVNANVSFDDNADVRIVNGNSGFIFNGDVTYNGTTVVQDIAPGLVQHTGGVNVFGNTTINATTIDWDGQGGSNNATTTINPNATFTLNTDKLDTGNPATDGFDDTVNINSGTLVVNTPATWLMEGIMNFDTSSGTAAVDGSAMRVRQGFFGAGTGKINAAGGGTAQINVPVTFENSSTVMVDVDTTLELNDDTIYNGPTVEGAGTMTHNSTAAINSGTSMQIGGFTIGDGSVVTMEAGDVETGDFDKDANGTFDFDGGTFTVKGGSGRFNSSFDFGRLTNNGTEPHFIVSDGADVAATGHWRIGFDVFTFGRTTITGTNGQPSTLRGTGVGDLIVGGEGVGHLEVTNGGFTDLQDDFVIGDDTGSAGDATVSGVNGSNRSTVLATGNGAESSVEVGDDGEGRLDIVDGALVATSGDAFIGKDPGSFGSVLLDGSSGGFNATLQVEDDLFIGGDGNGAGGFGDLEINGGGQLIVGGDIVIWPEGNLSVDNDAIIDPASLTVDGGRYFQEVDATAVFSEVDGLPGTGFYVGVGSGSGTVNVTNDGSMTVQDTFNVGPLGQVDISGQGTSFSSAELRIDGGTFRQGSETQVIISSTGNFAVGVGFFVGAGNVDGLVRIDDGLIEVNSGMVEFTGSAAVAILGGSFDAGGATTIVDGDAEVQVGGGELISELIQVDGGRLDLSGGRLLTALLDLTGGGNFNFTGGRLHAGEVDGDLVNEGGTLAPGASPGITNITGAYTQQADGTTEIEIDGATPGTLFDQVNVSGNAELEGLLDVSLGSFEPNYFASFEVMTANQIKGKFDLVTGAEVDENKTLAAIYGSGDVTLIAAIPGDGNLDGVVNFDDFVLITNDFEATDTFWGQGNYNQDSTTNIDDFFILTNHFKLQVSQLEPTGAAVPEPGAWLLLGIAGVFAARRKT